MWQAALGLLLALQCQLALAQPPRVKGLPSIRPSDSPRVVSPWNKHFGFTPKFERVIGTTHIFFIPYNSEELAHAAGVQIEQKLVTTEDGYILWMYRLGNNTGQPVLLQHGILLAPDSWLMRGPDRDLAHLLLKQGYDVYLGTLRGTAYSRFHVKYDRSDPRFWNFSIHEQGLYDVPAMIDKILTLTGKKNVSYIGHSQGTTVFLIMTSSRPEYNEKVNVGILISPVAFAPALSEFSPPFFRLATLNGQLIYDILYKMGNNEMFPRTEKMVDFIQHFCGPSPSQDFCLDLYGWAFGENRINVDRKNFGYQLSFAPAGTSLKTVYHFGQIYLTNQFKEYDYGAMTNFVKYNSMQPPNYRLEKVTSPTAIYWGSNDQIISKSAVKKLVSHLPNVIMEKMIPDPRSGHLDLLFGENAKEVLYDDIISLLNRLT